MFDLLLKDKFQVHEMKDLITGAMESIEEKQSKKRYIRGIPTGFQSLDYFISGLQKGHFIVVAGRPSMGKTSFVLSLAKHVAIYQNVPVLFFSLDSSKEDIALRLLVSQARVDMQKARTGFVSSSNIPKLTAAAGVLSDAKLYVEERPRLISQIEEKIAFYISKKKIGLVIIDSLQEIEGVGYEQTKERRRKVEGFCRKLKNIALKHQIPIVSTFWASRAFEVDHKKIPHLNNFSKEEGDLSSYADEILMLYREEYYFPTDLNKGVTNIRIIKNEFMNCGIANTHFFKEEGCFFEDAEAPRTGDVI
ncbi:MAG: DnaB-like helicase C-terminal domain-containing protein [Candidatus Omnitrophica bacterium]|nr:DnaB-like helicase C-terminal domain-containing protein [Candidatus Omnitrophota bacterium]